MTTLIQLSDPHLLPARHLQHGVVDTAAALEAALETVASAGISPAALLLTGDLADDGSPAAYHRLHALVQPVADRLGAAVIPAMGNHDDRAAFRSALLSTAPTTEPYYAVHRVGALRIVVLDSTVPGRHHGRLDQDQLDRLRVELSRPADQGTVLVVHHPPLPSPVPSVHRLRLHDADRLGEVIEGTDVRIVLTGHAHYAGCGSLAGIPVWVSPACSYRIDPVAPRGRLRGFVGSGLSRIDLIAGSAVATAVPVGPAAAIYDEDEAAVAAEVG